MSTSGSRICRLALVLCAGAACSLPLGITGAACAQGSPAGATRDAAAQSDPLPIRKITLYRSGVGFFEREGAIQGDAHIQLRFNTEQINDIIKSMVVLDRSGGKIDAISYGSKEPIARRLASFGVNIAGNPSIPELLDQLRGAPIRVTAGESITGTIMGVEDRLVPAGKDQAPIEQPHVNLLTATGIRTIAVSGMSSFEILDAELSAELNKALGALAEYRADRFKTVDLHFSANGQAGSRSVVVGYVQESPVWKVSYRLLLPDEPGAARTDKKSSLNVQGWAIVENNTDQDWQDVRLALVSGRPVSFQMDLYEPLYLSRPFIPVPTIPGVSPRAYSGGMDGALGKALASVGQSPFRDDQSDEDARARRRSAGREMAKSAPGSPPAAEPPMEAKSAYTGLSAFDMATYAAASAAGAAEVGEVFQYELASPVTIERQRSAMIPIMSANLSGRRVSIFNAGDGNEHPMRGVELKNDSDLQLLPGPISVFDTSDGKSAYAGDAQIGHVSQGDKRLLAYAVDLDVTALVKPESNSTVTKVRIVDGMFEQTVKTRNTTAYAFKNADQKRDRLIVLEHAKLDGWKLMSPDKPSEEAQGIYRFEVPVAREKTETVTVVQERVDWQRVGVTSIDTATILQYHKDGRLSDKVLETVREIGKRQAAINDAERSMQEFDRQISAINQDQSRIRENMGRIDKNSQLYARYMTKLTEQETQLEDLTTKRAEAQANRDTLRQRLDEYIRTLNVD
ncbi:MAG: hypothetical protein AB7G11_01450 [Phycisphaerales bacterium]